MADHPTPQQSHEVSKEVSHDVTKDVYRYVVVGVGLMVVMLVMVFVSLHLGPEANIWPVLGLALLQAVVVAGLFMHLAAERWTIYRFLIFTVVFVFFMFFLMGLSLRDRIHF